MRPLLLPSSILRLLLMYHWFLNNPKQALIHDCACRGRGPSGLAGAADGAVSAPLPEPEAEPEAEPDFTG